MVKHRMAGRWLLIILNMKSVLQDLTQEIDYLGALAEMYGQGCAVEAQAAALEAKAALERLFFVLSDSTDNPHTKFPTAA